jgi:hypothetical protein
MERQEADQGSMGITKIPLLLHRVLVVLIYFVALVAVRFVLSLPEAKENLTTWLSSAAILATFGAALSSLGAMSGGDMFNRILGNVDIFYMDIAKQDRWRRWPFLPRAGSRKTLDGSQLVGELCNPQIPLDVGTHVMQITLPTVAEDLIDLPLLANLYPLWRFRSAAHTLLANASSSSGEKAGVLPVRDNYMAYECMYDIWRAVARFRVSRYITHAGNALTIFATVLAALHVASGRI